MKSQASEASNPKSLQSQSQCRARNRLALKRLAIVHGRLASAARPDHRYPTASLASRSNQRRNSEGGHAKT
jgi:hypothetical protein